MFKVSRLLGVGMALVSSVAYNIAKRTDIVITFSCADGSPSLHCTRSDTHKKGTLQRPFSFQPTNDQLTLGSSSPLS
jgi:hypothetical protein